jgi:hypothetical protein
MLNVLAISKYHEVFGKTNQTPEEIPQNVINSFEITCN